MGMKLAGVVLMSLRVLWRMNRPIGQENTNHGKNSGVRHVAIVGEKLAGKLDVKLLQSNSAMRRVVVSLVKRSAKMGCTMQSMLRPSMSILRQLLTDTNAWQLDRKL